MANSFSDLITRIIGYVKNGTGATGESVGMGNIDTRVGSVMRDGILTPNAFEFTNVYNNINEVSSNQGILTASAQSDASLDNLASNYGIERATGGYAAGTIRFIRYVQPISNISIPAGTIVYTELAGVRVSFHTLSTVVLTSSSPTDIDLGYYYVDALITCDTLGTVGNVAAEAISYVEVTGVDGCINLAATTGGTDIQTNAAMVESIASTARSNLGTRTGYESLVRDNFGVTDVTVITASDVGSVRAQYGGAIDVVVLDETRTAEQDTVEYAGATATAEIIPTFKPMMAVTQIAGGTGGSNILVEGATGDYEVEYDTYSVVQRSESDRSKILLHIVSFVPLEPSNLVVDYTIAPMVPSVQAFLDEDDNKVLGSDVMVKAGIEVGVIVTAQVKLFSGHSSVTVLADIVTALGVLLDAKMLNENIQASDVISVITNVDGVDSVDLTTFSMAKASAPSTDLEEIIVGKQEYVRLSSTNIAVV